MSPINFLEGDHVTIRSPHNPADIKKIFTVIKNPSGSPSYPWSLDPAPRQYNAFSEEELAHERIEVKEENVNETQFKVGDRVKIVSPMKASGEPTSKFDSFKGTVTTVTGVDLWPYTLACAPHLGWNARELELVEATIPASFPQDWSPFINKKITNQGNNTMNLLTYAKLNKDQRLLNKVGVMDTNGRLTDDGRELLLDVLAQDAPTQKRLVDLAKEYKDDLKADK